MAKYKIFFRQSVIKKDIANIPKNDTRKIVDVIHGLADNTHPFGVQKLSGQERYRIRQGGYRIIFSIQDDEPGIWIVKVGHRRDVYR